MTHPKLIALVLPALLLTACANHTVVPATRTPSSFINTNCTTDCSSSTATPTPISGTYSDQYGDQLNILNNSGTLTGESVGFVFYTSNFYADYGTYTFYAGYGAPGFGSGLHSPLPRSAACNGALAKLNTDFLALLGVAFPITTKFGRNGLPYLFAKLNPAKIGIILGGIAAVLQLNTDQNGVNTMCRGQGAGAYPYG